MKYLQKPSADTRQVTTYASTALQRAKAGLAIVAPLERDPFAFRFVSTKALIAHSLDKRKARGEGADNVRSALEALKRLPSPLKLVPPPTGPALARLANDHPNFSSVVDYVQRCAALSRLVPQSPLVISPILLLGPPGIGKTHFAREFANALNPNAGLMEFNMSTATASFSLGGLDAQYAGGGPGYLVRTLISTGVPDAVILVDELEKVHSDPSHNPAGPLLSLLEPSTARQFVDDGLRLPLDLSALRWVGTTNDVRSIDPALLSRWKVFEIEKPSPEQIVEIARRVYSTLIAQRPWGRHFIPTLSDDVVEILLQATPRDLERVLCDALGAAALRNMDRIDPDDVPRLKRFVPMGFAA